MKTLQPRAYGAFRCISADCEDTCCVGWIVNIDKQTYDAYQHCDHPQLGPRLRELVTINTAATNADNYARMTLSASGCSFLEDGLCSIQKRLGEQYLSMMCSAYPRVRNMVDDALQQSLDLSCPEAARLMLLDPAPMEFVEQDQSGVRLGHLSVLSTADPASAKPYTHFREIHSFNLWLLQNRRYSLWRRIVLLGSFCDQIQAGAAQGHAAQTPDVIAAYRDAIQRGSFDQALDSHRPRPAEQIGAILELIVARIGSDFTALRFRECYQEFMAGLDWTADVSMDELSRRYAAAYSDWYLPLMSRHEHILEHYLVSYAYRTLFPLGPQHSSQNITSTDLSIREQCMLMLACYGIIQAVAIGMADFHREKFAVPHILKVIQAVAKTFEHSLAFPARAIQILGNNGITNCAGWAILLLN